MSSRAEVSSNAFEIRWSSRVSESSLSRIKATLLQSAPAEIRRGLMVSSLLSSAH